MPELPGPMATILDLARWAPSGDNSQPWRFEVVSDTHLVIHGQDTRDWCVYDLDGRASQIAIGALMENIAIAASDQGFRADFRPRDDVGDCPPTIDVHLVPDATLERDPLIDQITRRTTQRRPLSTRSLDSEQKQALEESVGAGFSVGWVEGAGLRWRMARLLSRNARIRLTIPEAYEVHRRIIEWDAQCSEDRIPDQAVGLDPVGLKLMHWAMGSWGRVRFLNTYLAGTWLPRLQLDLLPGYFCAAHFAIASRRPLATTDDYLAAGRATQRFWLTATALGLQLQPEMTPLIFSRYSAANKAFTCDSRALADAKRLASELQQLAPKTPLSHTGFMGRVGHGKAPTARSTRPKVQSLLVKV